MYIKAVRVIANSDVRRSLHTQTRLLNPVHRAGYCETQLELRPSSRHCHECRHDLDDVART